MSEFFRLLLVLSSSILLMLYQPNDQKSGFCPTLPAGLHNVVSLEWQIPDEVVLVSIGNEKAPEYLRVWIEWNLRDATIEIKKDDNVIPFLTILQELGLEQELSYTYVDNEPLFTFSPSRSDFVFSRGDDLYYVELKNGFEITSETFLGTAPFFDIINVTWLSTNELIVISHPPYGDGFEIAHICLRENFSFDNSYPFPFVPDRPGVDPINKRIAAYDLSRRMLTIFDVAESPTPTLIEMDYSLLPRVEPIWSTSENEIYLLGTNSIELTLLSIDLDSNNTIEIVTLDGIPASFTPDEWLISLDSQFLLATSATNNREVSIYCFL